jgi:hypothetical protein
MCDKLIEEIAEIQMTIVENTLSKSITASGDKYRSPECKFFERKDSIVCVNMLSKISPLLYGNSYLWHPASCYPVNMLYIRISFFIPAYWFTLSSRKKFPSDRGRKLSHPGNPFGKM